MHVGKAGLVAMEVELQGGGGYQEGRKTLQQARDILLPCEMSYVNILDVLCEPTIQARDKLPCENLAATGSKKSFLGHLGSNKKVSMPFVMQEKSSRRCT